jgi:NAD(P)-dependent dehydrogenase (short-subunit alcohol dehydrogenase family)
MVVLAAGASLLGRAVCLELAAQGANLAITDFSKAEGQELCLEIQNSGHKGNLVLSTFDPKDSARLVSFVRGVAKTFKTVHAIVNCATWSPEVQFLL